MNFIFHRMRQMKNVHFQWTQKVKIAHMIVHHNRSNAIAAENVFPKLHYVTKKCNVQTVINFHGYMNYYKFNQILKKK